MPLYCINKMNIALTLNITLNPRPVTNYNPNSKPSPNLNHNSKFKIEVCKELGDILASFYISIIYES